MSGGGARTRVKMRERAINVKSRLVLRETPDLGADEDDDQTQDEGAPINHLMNVEIAHEEGEDVVEGGADQPTVLGQKQKTRQQQQLTEDEKEKQKKAKVEMAMIPTPPIFEDPEYDRQNFLPWRPPESLIKFVANTGSELNTAFDFYELRQDDVVWLRSYNEVTKPSRPVTEDQMESLLDLFEKEAAYRSKLIDPVNDFSCAVAKVKAREQYQLVGAFVEHIYEYWRARRKMLRKALMRKFQTPPIEPGPHVAFVPRVPSRRASSRNPRKNDSSSFRKMVQLKEDFGRVLAIIARLKRREVLKRHLLQVQAEEFDQALEKTHWATQLAPEKEAAMKKRQEEKELFEEKKRQKQAERAGRAPLPVDEHPEFPGYFLGPFFTFPEAYSVELQTCDPKKTERENCGALLVSNIPHSNYVDENEGVELEAEKKDNRLLKRAKTTPRGGAKAHSNHHGNNNSNHNNNSHHASNQSQSTGSSAGNSTSSHTLVLPRPPLRVKRNADASKAVCPVESAGPASSLSACESSSSESEDWEDERASDDEYYASLEQYLVQHGRDPRQLSSFLSRAFDDISLSVPPLEKPQRGNGVFSKSDEAVPMEDIPDPTLVPQPSSRQHRTLRDFSWTPPVKLPLLPTSLPRSVDHEQELRALERLDEYKGYCRGRISRCGRAFFDVYWKQGKAELEPLSESDSEVEDINLDLIDAAFTLSDGVVTKVEPPLAVRSVGTYILPE